jgi:hypothetical protein
MNTTDIVAKLWNLCHVLRDDGITYQEYVNELSYLLFLKMMQETGQEGELPAGYRLDSPKVRPSMSSLQVVHPELSVCSSYVMMPWTTDPCTSVRRKSRPAYR